MKTCFKCGATKPLSEFYAHKKMADGHLNKCKECTKSDARKHRADNVASARDYDRQRANLPHRVAARAGYAASERGRETGNAAKRAYANRNPERQRAHYLFGNAVRDGRLTPLPCEVCGAEQVEGHHPAYSLPLVVTWLCTPHHTQLHTDFRALQRTNP